MPTPPDEAPSSSRSPTSSPPEPKPPVKAAAAKAAAAEKAAPKPPRAKAVAPRFEELRELPRFAWNGIEAPATEDEPRELGRVIGHVAIHERDEPEDVLLRAKGVLAGNIPLDKATRLRADALLRTRNGEIVAGTIFDAEDIEPEDLERFYKAGAVVPVA